MTLDSTVDPNNFSRIAIALERWIKAGELLTACLEKTGDTTNFPQVHALRQQTQKLRETIAQLKG